MCPEGQRSADTCTAVKEIRLNKYLSQAGICSRRQADLFMEQGLVTVDGRRAMPGTVVTGNETIKVDGRIVQGNGRKVIVAWYKPAGVTTTFHDPHARITVEDAFHYPGGPHLTYAGRLDKDSEGLLIMTNDGDLIDAMMRGAGHHEKEYIVRTRSRISDEQLHRMERGIYLTELGVRTRPCRIERLGEYTFRIVLTQGLNRQIRRMCHAVGSEVKTLKRVRVLNITARGLQPGMWREIRGAERDQLYEAAGMKKPAGQDRPE